MMKNILIRSAIFVFLLSAYACHSDKKAAVTDDGVRNIHVTVNDSLYQGIDSVFSLERLITLDSEPLLTSIKRLEFADGRIFLTDESSRLFCYDDDGKFLYKIDARGNGPGEYVDITFFTVDAEKKEIAVFDNQAARILFYDMGNGSFLRGEALKKPNPTDARCRDGRYYYDNRFHFNYPEDKDLHYFLLLSSNGVDIEQAYFPHDEKEHAFDFSPSATRLYPSDPLLLYCKDFDPVVYELQQDEVKARYKFHIPDWLPEEEIERKIDVMKLLRSGYAYGINDVYECDEVLSFRFFQKGFVLSALYDLKNDRLHYCGKLLMKEPGERVPLISAVVGVHDGCFVSVLSPEFIDYHHQRHPDRIGKLLPGYNPESDNPVIALYGVND